MFYAFASDVDLSMLGASLTKAGLELPLKINTPLFSFTPWSISCSLLLV